MIVALFTELAAGGGVQRAGRLTAAALLAFAGRRDERCVLLSLNDPVNAPPVRVGVQEMPLTGFGRSKTAFVASALRYAVQGPRLVIALHPHLAPVAAAMKLCAMQTRSIVFAHGIEVWTPLGRNRRYALRRSDLVLAPSADTVLQVATQQGVAAEKIKKLAWSLGPEFDGSATPGNRWPAPPGFPDGRVILTVGRWDASEAYKGVDHLIAALPALLEDVPDAHLVAVGGGSDLPRLTQCAMRSGVAQRVHFLPHMNAEELCSAYAACDIFALPSRGEGFGLVFLEAMSYGKPVIGGAHGGTPDIVDDGVTGYLVPYGDVPQLTVKLKSLLTDEATRRQMGLNAFERVRRDFTFARFARQLEMLLEEVARQARRPNRV